MVCRKVKLFYSFLGRCPHVDSSNSEEQPDAAEAVMEAQWKSYVDKLRQSGQLSSCLAVADVSGSMYGEPMNVCGSFLPCTPVECLAINVKQLRATYQPLSICTMSGLRDDLPCR